MAKPQLSTMIELEELKSKAIEMLDEHAKGVAKIIKNHGEGRFDYEIEETEGHGYVKFELVDNIRKLTDGEPVLTHSYVKPVELKRTFLKRIPESLKPKK